MERNQIMDGAAAAVDTMAAASGRVNIGVSVDIQLWRRLRALAIREGRLTGELLDAAIQDYLEQLGG